MCLFRRYVSAGGHAGLCEPLVPAFAAAPWPGSANPSFADGRTAQGRYLAFCRADCVCSITAAAAAAARAGLPQSRSLGGGLTHLFDPWLTSLAGLLSDSAVRPLL